MGEKGIAAADECSLGACINVKIPKIKISNHEYISFK